MHIANFHSTVRQIPGGWRPVTLHEIARVRPIGAASAPAGPAVLHVRSRPEPILAEQLESRSGYVVVQPGDLLLSPDEVRVVRQHLYSPQVTDEFIALELNGDGVLPTDPECVAILMESDVIREQFSPWRGRFSETLATARDLLPKVLFPYPADPMEEETLVRRAKPVLLKLVALQRAAELRVQEAEPLLEAVLEQRFRGLLGYGLVPLTRSCTVVTSATRSEPGDLVLSADVLAHRAIGYLTEGRPMRLGEVILRPLIRGDNQTVLAAWWLCGQVVGLPPEEGWRSLTARGWERLLTPAVPDREMNELVAQLSACQSHMARIRSLHEDQISILNDLWQSVLGDLSEGALRV